MAIKIFIDQGHNPQNPNAGAEGNGLREQDITYEIGRQLSNLLNSNPNFESRLSRSSPNEILGMTTGDSLRARVNAANSWGADYFISLHTNASETVFTASGCEGYVYRTDSEAYYFSESILIGLSNTVGIPNRGVFARPTLYVLRKTAMPSTLIEMGFITTPEEAFRMANQPLLYAQGIYNGILAYFGLL